MLAFGIFLLFYNYQQSLMTPQNFYPFMLLTFVGMGLLLALLFLVNKQHPTKAVKASSPKRPSKKKKK